VRARILLFDIDGTLLSTGGAGRRAMEDAFVDLHGPLEESLAFPFAGMTDRAIARQGLSTRGIDGSEEAIDALLSRYLRRLDDELASSEGYEVMPGILELVEWLASAHPSVATGLGTGNIREGAYRKLARGALDRPFSFGGFGCDSEDRAELLALRSLKRPHLN